eukprot:TRINITY_DN87661_c0_g1_i1.p1 TRINITY_DN87661_c0_g1~~TRINITY_DN87661_c0_g1_i1.p1  ORF type:complete len:305 (+),score=67.46 TRINITY_DN87661_c0_g1_i1:51-965(+)
MPAADQLKAIKAKFQKTDTSGDGKLDENELAALLRKGNPRMTAGEITMLFRKADTNRDGRLSFEEFADFIFGQSPEASPAMKEVFANFAGGASEMDERKFEKLCRDCCLYNSALKPGDARLIFSKVKSGRTLGLSEFMKALQCIADKRGCAIEEVCRALEMQGCPRADDDAQRRPASPSATAGYQGGNRNAQARNSAGRTVKAPREGPRRALTSTEIASRRLLDVYMSYANRNGDMDVRAFCKCLQECDVVDAGLSAMDAELIFGQVCKRSDRKLTFADFRIALEQVAQKKGCDAEEVELTIGG